MTPYITSEDVCHVTRDEFGCDMSSNQSLSDSQTTEPMEIKNRNLHRVRFQSVKPKVLNPETEYFSEDECLARWWSAEELQKIRQRAKTLCSRIRYHAKCEDYELITAHRKITLILTSDFRSLMKLSRSLPNQDLSIWCAYNDGRRGLECFASKVFSCFRTTDVVETREAVLREQVRQCRQGVNNPDMLAELCQRASRRARSFAHFMADADADQVGKSRKVSHECNYLSKIDQTCHTI